MQGFILLYCIGILYTVSAQPAGPAAIGEECAPVSGCSDLHAQCMFEDVTGAQGVCQCNFGYIQASGKCTNLGETCAAGLEPCSDPMSACDADTNRCLCINDTANVNGICRKNNAMSFDCRRYNVGCKNEGTCDMTTGRCECMEGYDMFDCGLDISLIDEGKSVEVDIGNNETTTVMQYACDDFGACNNGGKCYLDGGEAKCYCDCSYFGKNCDKTRVMAECSATRMTIYANPHGEFMGNIYVMGDSETCKLEVDELAEGDYSGVRMIRFRHRNMKARGCSVDLGEMNNTPKKGDKTFYQDIIVEYSPVFTSNLDARYRVYCVHSRDTTVGAVVGEKVIVDQDKDLPQGHRSDDTYSPIKMDIVDEKGDAISVRTPVQLGSQLRAKFSLAAAAGPGGSVFTKARVEMCCAFDSLDVDNANTKHIDLITNSCPDMESAGVVGIPLKEMEFDLTAFKFQGNSEMVNLMCQCKLCQSENEDECAPRDCSDRHTGGEVAGFGRKRRALNNTVSGLTVSSSFIVVGLKDRGTPTKEAQPSLTFGSDGLTATVGCFQSMGFLVTVGILSFVLLISLCIVLFLFIRLRSEQRYNGEQQTMMYPAPYPAFDNTCMPNKC